MDSGWVRKNTYATTSSSAGGSWGQVTPLPFFGPDEELVEALRKGHPGAAKAFYDRYSDIVDRVLSRVVGAHDDAIPDLMQDAFLRAIAGIGRLRDPSRLQVWVATAAVSAARAHLQRRSGSLGASRVIERLARLLRGTASRSEPRTDERVRAARANDALSRAMYAFYDVLDAMPVEERIALALRVIDAMPLAEIAEVNRVSIGQLKRRLRRAEARFVLGARRAAVLRPWLDRGSRWTLPILG